MKKILKPLILSILLIGILYFLADILSGQSNMLDEIFSRLDSKHYINLSLEGYNTENISLFAFFPLLPIELFLLISFLTFLNTNWVILVAVFFNFLICFFGIYNLQKFICERNKQKHLLIYTLIAVVLPFTMFFYVPYTESLFVGILFNFIYLYFNWGEQSKLGINILMALLAFLLGLTRNVGIVIGVIIVFDTLTNLKLYLKNLKLIFRNVVLGISNIAGTLLFFYYGLNITGNFFISAEVQKYWGRSFTLNIFDPIFTRIREVINFSSICNADRCKESYFVELGAVVLVILLSIIIIRKFKNDKYLPTLFIASFFLWIMPLFSNSLQSYNRYIIVAPFYLIYFPLIFTGHKKSSIVFLIFSILITLLTFILHFKGYWIG